jgi:hypothetical protein
MQCIAVMFGIVYSLPKGCLAQARFREVDVLLYSTILLAVTALSVIVLNIVSVAIL